MTIQIVDGIMLRACMISGLTPEGIKEKRRLKEIVRIRQAMALALRRRTAYSFPQIARHVGVTDHSTVIHSIKLATYLLDHDAEFAAMFGEFMMAPPIPAFSLRARLAKLGDELRESYTAPIKVTEPKPVPVVQKIVQPPPKPVVAQHEWEKIELPGRTFMMNQDGYTEGDIHNQNSMARGSMLLAKAVNDARASTRGAA